MCMQVRVWDADTGQCTICHNFGRPIASLAFHAGGDYLAVASGHKVSHRSWLSRHRLILLRRMHLHATLQ